MKTIIVFISTLSILLFTACTRKNRVQKSKLIIFHAGSLSVPFKKMEEEFELKHPDVDILREPAGSTKCARKIIDLKKPCDIMASADYRIIDDLLIAEYAGWNILFANNQMVLCYTPESKYAGTIDTHNWYNILMKKDTVWGHADPDIDPCGYRALFVLQLAESYYKQPGLYKKLLQARREKSIRPKSVELISLMETGNMDYAWEYLSIAIQHGLKYITLPERINLGNPEFDNQYKNASVQITGKEPGTKMNISGQSITYGITLVRNAPNKKTAIEFLKYMLDPDGGLKILKESGQPPLIPVRVKTEKIKKILPDPLQKMVQVMKHL